MVYNRFVVNAPILFAGKHRISGEKTEPILIDDKIRKLMESGVLTIIHTKPERKEIENVTGSNQELDKDASSKKRSVGRYSDHNNKPRKRNKGSLFN